MKIGYETYDDALTAAELQMDSGAVKPGCHITPYRCDDCGAFHLWNRVIVPLDPREVRL